MHRVFHLPTDLMIMDGLTKVGTFPKLMKYLTTGIIDLDRSDNNNKRIEKPIIIRMSRIKENFSEYDLMEINGA